MNGAGHGPELAWSQVAARITQAYDTRVALVSPPRTGSSLVARLLWQHPAITHHCHEPFEACYWGGYGPQASARNLLNPIDLASGEGVPLADVAGGSGLLIKEMSFQLKADQFLAVARLSTVPVVFVVRDPRLSTTSRLRIVDELYGKNTFPPFESGWPALTEQLGLCRAYGIAYIIVNSTSLRRSPERLAARLLESLGLSPQPGVTSWRPRPGLQLCDPETGALMSDKRTEDDPFYRRVLSSSGVQPPDAVDWRHEEALITDAGLSRDVAAWLTAYDELRGDPHLLDSGRAVDFPAGCPAPRQPAP